MGPFLYILKLKEVERMSKHLFTEPERHILEHNPNVTRVSEKAITYSDAFKVSFIEQYEKGKTARHIFEEAGFDVDVVTIGRIKECASRWSRAVKQHGSLGLRDGRKFNSGRPTNRSLTTEEQLKHAQAKIDYLEGEIAFIKKLELSEKQGGNDTLRPHFAYALIAQLCKSSQRMVSLFCDIAGVSRSGYYAYLSSRSRIQREAKDEALKHILLKAIHYKNRYKGTRSIVMMLKNRFNLIINRKCVQRICRKYGLLSCVRKANPYRRMMKATHEHRTLPNQLKREFKQGRAGHILLTDVTYIPYHNGKMAYLSAIKDAETNEILAYQLSQSLEISFVLETVKQLTQHHQSRLHPDAYIHSDQGAHYTSPKFQRLLKQSGLGQSMSRRGNCWDNAPMESFFGHMKDENDFKTCQSFQELSDKIDTYMDYYNHDRSQWTLKKLTPINYRRQLQAA